MATIPVSQPVNTNEEQSLYSEKSMLYTELASTETEKLSERHALKFPEPEFDIKQYSTVESQIKAPIENENLISSALGQTQTPKNSVAVSRYRTAGVRRRGRLSEF